MNIKKRKETFNMNNNTNKMYFENVKEIIDASQEHLRPLIGRTLTKDERDLINIFFYHYFNIPEEEPILITKRSWIIFTNRLVILFERQIREFDELRDKIILLKQADPNIVFGYTDDGMMVHDFDELL